jgi:hypothetical protein
MTLFTPSPELANKREARGVPDWMRQALKPFESVAADAKSTAGPSSRLPTCEAAARFRLYQPYWLAGGASAGAGACGSLECG